MDKSFLYNCFVTGSLKSLFQRALQEQAWQQGVYTNYVDYSEIVMNFYEDCEYLLNQEKHCELTEDQSIKIHRLYEMVEDFDQTVPMQPDIQEHQRIVSDPQWEKIRQYAEQIYEELLDKK